MDMGRLVVKAPAQRVLDGEAPRSSERPLIITRSHPAVFRLGTQRSRAAITTQHTPLRQRSCNALFRVT